MHRFHVLLLSVVIIFVPGWALGAPISVETSPSTPSISDSVFLDTTLEWWSSGYWVEGSYWSFLSNYELQINITVSAPDPINQYIPLIMDEVHTIDLGLLPAGTYSYTVIETDVQRMTGLVTGGGSLSGSFDVVPEPSTATLALLGLVGLAAKRQIDSKHS